LFRNRNFILLWIAQCISVGGDTFTFLSLAIRINDLYTDPRESVWVLGAVLISFALPQLLLGIFAGTVVDRFDRRRIMIVSDVLRALLVPCFILLRTPNDLPWIMVLGFLVASTSAFFNPARTALIPALVKDEDLLSANGWIQVGQTIARLAGPILAGIVIARWGTDVSFLIDAASFVVSGALVFFITGVITHVEPAEVKEHSAWEDLKQGAKFATHSRLLQGIVLGAAFAMLGLGAINVLLVPFLNRVLGAAADAIGGLMSAQALGMLLGGLLLGILGKRMPPVFTAIASLTLFGIAGIFFGLAPSFTFALLVVPFVGLVIPPLTGSMQTLLQRGVEKSMIGRASSFVEMSMGTANLISMGAAGWLGSWLGLQETFVMGGGLMILGAMASGMLLRKSGRKLRLKLAGMEGSVSSHPDS
jgi:MFS family permease